MENAADALKIAAAIFIFIIALSVTFSTFYKVKNAADDILVYSDKTNYYDKKTGTLTEKGRVVGKDVIISTLNKGEVYVNVVKKDGTIYNFSTSDKDTEDFIKNKLGDETIYYESISEITMSGKYSTGEDGTKLVILPGETRTYVTYTEY